MSTGHSTKERLIATAMELIWRSSYGSVSVDGICKAADVKKGSFYHFFPSKADLAIAALEHYYNDSLSVFDEIFDQSRPPLERFEKYVEFILKKQKETAKKYGHVCGCPFASLGSEMAGQEEIIRQSIQNTMGRYKARYYEATLKDMVRDGLLDDDINIKLKAQEVFSYLLGQVMLARIQNDLRPLNKSMKGGLYKILGVSIETA